MAPSSNFQRFLLAAISAVLVASATAACTSTGDGGTIDTATDASVVTTPVVLETLPGVTESTSTLSDVTEPGAAPTILDVRAGSVAVDLVSTVVIGAPELIDFDLTKIQRATASPSGRVAYPGPQSLCILDVDTQPVSTCTPMDRSLDANSLTWSPDERLIAGRNDPLDGDVDIMLFDVGSGTSQVIGDDADDSDDSDDSDFGPFFDEDGTLHFFRATVSDAGIGSILHRVEAGEAMSTDLTVGFLPTGAMVVDGSTALGPSTGPDGLGLAVVDLAAETSEVFVNRQPVSLSSLDVFDVIDGSALLVAPQSSAVQAALFDVSAATIAPINIVVGEDRQLTGIGIDSTGTRLAAIVEDRSDPNGHLLLIADIDPAGIIENGGVSTFHVAAIGSAFAPNDGDKTIRPQGLGDAMQIIWRDGEIVYGLGPSMLVRLPIS